MKRPITLMLAIMATFTLTAQTMNVHFKNGQKIEFSSDIVDYVDFTEKPAPPTLTEGAYVDLGLSVKWATCNLPGKTPTQGNIYQWGETTPGGGGKLNYIHYNPVDGGYTSIGGNIAGTPFDAATVNLGKDWRTPTVKQFEELMNSCDWEWGQINGRNGYYVTGVTGNTIFLPTDNSTEGNYWTAEGGTRFPDCFIFDRNKKQIFFAAGYMAYSIRPVYAPKQEPNISDSIKLSRDNFIYDQNIMKWPYEIRNNSHETIHILSLGKVTINRDLEAGQAMKMLISVEDMFHMRCALKFSFRDEIYYIVG